MKCRNGLAILSVGIMAASVAFAYQPAKDTKPANTPGAKQPGKPGETPAGQPGEKPQFTPPPGMSEADMQACMEAGTPGKMHEHLAKSVGTWDGKVKMWMAPGTEPMESTCTTVISTKMDGRFTTCETSGEMPGMGPFNGFGIYGFDNVSEKFQSTWVDNCGTGMMVGTGELSPDGKTLNWNYTFNCPIKKGPIAIREVERWTGPNTMVLEMHMPSPIDGKEYKMMEITSTRRAGTAGITSGQ